MCEKKEYADASILILKQTLKNTRDIEAIRQLVSPKKVKSEILFSAFLSFEVSMQHIKLVICMQK